MGHKRQSLISAEVFIRELPHAAEQAHLFEHIYFLEERANMLEKKVDHLRHIFMELLETNEEDYDEEDDEDEDDILTPNCCCRLWAKDDVC